MLGGRKNGHRALFDHGDFGAFEKMVDRTIGDRVRADQSAAEDLWAALANVDWTGPNGEEIGYSFRAAGDLCAALRRDEGEMTYTNYYMRKPDGFVAGWIEEAFGAEGWTSDADEDESDG